MFLESGLDLAVTKTQNTAFHVIRLTLSQLNSEVGMDPTVG